MIDLMLINLTSVGDADDFDLYYLVPDEIDYSPVTGPVGAIVLEFSFELLS